MANQVTLTFAGESRGAEQAFSRVEDASQKMGGRVEEAGGKFGKVGEASDEMASKASTATGAFGALASGADLWNLKSQNRLTTLDMENQKTDNQIAHLTAQKEALDKTAQGHGAAAVAAGKESAAIQGSIDKLNQSKQARDDEALKINEQMSKTQQLTTYLMGAQLAFDTLSGVTDLATLALKANTIGMVASKVASVASAGATKAWAAAQWIMNSALLASPLTWVVVAIAAIVAIIVLIATKTDWFQKGWRAAWGWIKSAASNTWDFLKKIPGWIQTAFGKVANFIIAPYRAAFNGIARLWNNTIGQLSWSVPSWVPLIGGNSISVPHLPTFHAGGTVPGVVGTAVPILAMAGEHVTSVAGSSGGDDGGWVTVRGDALIDQLTRMIATHVSGSGGRAAKLGIKVV
jgi:hypothetical protein